MELLPAPLVPAAVSVDSVARRVEAERARDSRATRQYYARAKQWWAEYAAIHPSFKVCAASPALGRRAGTQLELSLVSVRTLH